MSRYRYPLAASVVAITLTASALVVPQAGGATVEKQANGNCMVKFEPEEQAHRLAVFRKVDAAAAEVAARAVDTLFPGAGAVIEEYARDPENIAAAKGLNEDNLDTIDQIFEQTIPGYLDRLTALGVPEALAERALALTIVPLFPQVDGISFFNTKDEWETTPKVAAGYSSEKRFREFLSEGLVVDSLKPEQQLRLNRVLAEDAQLSRALAELAPIDAADRRAINTCYEPQRVQYPGGTSEVPEPKDPEPKDPESKVDEKPRAESPEEASSVQDLSRGAIAGIVIGVLAVLGLAAAAAAPMLGVKLPF